MSESNSDTLAHHYHRSGQQAVGQTRVDGTRIDRSRIDRTWPEDDPKEVISGRIRQVRFRNAETMFAVCVLEPHSTEHNTRSDAESDAVLSLDTVTIVGEIPLTLSKDSHVMVTGRWITHERFGKQFRISSIVESRPPSLEDLEVYLSSKNIHGIGPALAKTIIAHFGEETWDVLENAPERLKEVPKIGKKKIREITENWKSKRKERQVLMFFQSYDIPLTLATRIYNTLGPDAVATVTDNPYVLARLVPGIGFITADKIALQVGITATSPKRMAAALCHAMTLSTEDGHLYLPLPELLSRIPRILNISSPAEMEELPVLDGLSIAIEERSLVQEDDRIYVPELRQAENGLATLLAERLTVKNSSLPSVNKAVLTSMVGNQSHVLQKNMTRTQSPQNSAGEVPSELNVNLFTLSPEQQDALLQAAASPMLVITGGPGCGKTTVIRSLVELFKRSGLKVLLAAPTGKAAQRMAEVTNTPAKTIHRLLIYDPNSSTFEKNKSKPLEGDLLIIDETSMLDCLLAYNLLSALQPTTRLVFVGDADQLPSVGAGTFLQDLLKIKQVPRIYLTKIFRRSEQSHINEIARSLNSGTVPNIPVPDGATTSDAYFIERQEPSEIAALVEKLFLYQLPQRFNLRHEDISILSPMNQGELGIVALNKRIQQALWEKRKAECPPELMAQLNRDVVTVGETEFRINDRVIHRINNYQLGTSGVFNGDQGKIIAIDKDAQSLTVELWDGRTVEYTRDILHQLDLAYCITIHRSQGSEIPAVILVLHNSHTIMLERQLVYTGITRSKKLLVIVGTMSALERSTRSHRSRRRHSHLVARTEQKLTGI